MNFILNIFKGMLIGTGAILPGISSGVLCVILGIYENLISRILHFFKNKKENFLFFLPLLIGIGISVIFVSKVLLFLLENYTVPTSFVFIGLIIGCIPGILKQANISPKHKNPFLKYLFLIFTFTFSIYLITLAKSLNITTLSADNISNFNLIKNGFLMSAGVVVPGISNTEILMLLGSYNLYLEALSSINLHILIPMGIGLIIGSIIFLKLIEFLFSNFKTYTYYAIIGFTLGSIFVIIPSFNFDLTFIFSIILMILSFFASFKLSSLERNQRGHLKLVPIWDQFQVSPLVRRPVGPACPRWFGVPVSPAPLFPGIPSNRYSFINRFF